MRPARWVQRRRSPHARQTCDCMCVMTGVRPGLRALCNDRCTPYACPPPPPPERVALLLLLYDMMCVQQPSTTNRYGRFFSVGYIANKSAVIVACGVGMTNSAMTTTMLVDMYDMKYMLFSVRAWLNCPQRMQCAHPPNYSW